MKKLLAYLVSPPLYWAGHLVSIPMCRIDFLGHLYPLYNWLMCRSSDIEEWAEVNIMWRLPG